jgi:hypothetical protein
VWCSDLRRHHQSNTDSSLSRVAFHIRERAGDGFPCMPRDVRWCGPMIAPALSVHDLDAVFDRHGKGLTDRQQMPIREFAHQTATSEMSTFMETRPGRPPRFASICPANPAPLRKDSDEALERGL